MEVERERFEQAAEIKNGKVVAVGAEHSVGKEKFEFGGPGDEISRVVGGTYITSWNGDFLQKELDREGTLARFYIDKRIGVDIADPETKLAQTKRKLLFRHGFAYLCIPPGFEKSEKKLGDLYAAALEEYRAYEKLHPRPDVLQETVIVDSEGRARRAMVTAIDTKVGGGLKGSVEQQKAEIAHASKLSKKELHKLELRSKMHRKLRRAAQNGTPFRNPFVAPGKRLYPVSYSS